MNKEELKKFLEEATPYFNLVYGKNRWWLTGSAFLLFNGYIDRDINDIDINTAYDFFHEPPEWYNKNPKMYEFFVNKLNINIDYPKVNTTSTIIDSGKDLPILCSSYLFGTYNLYVDVFYNPYFAYDAARKHFLRDPRIEKTIILKYIIEYKNLMIANKVHNMEKHTLDLEFISKHVKLNNLKIMEQFNITLRPFKMESDCKGTYPHFIVKRELTTEEVCHILHEILLIELSEADDFWDKEEYIDYLNDLVDSMNNWLIGVCEEDKVLEKVGIYDDACIGIWNAFKIAEYLIEINVI